MDLKKENSVFERHIIEFQERELSEIYKPPSPSKFGFKPEKVKSAFKKNNKGKSTSGKVLKGIPKGSVIKGYGGGWGSWGQDLALVFYTDDFDINNLTKEYVVWYAIDADTKKKIKAIPQYVNYEPKMVPSNVSFDKAMFKLFNGMVPTHIGTFEKPVTYKVKMNLKTLTNDERRRIIMNLEDEKYLDVGGHKLTKKDWEKMLGMTYDEIMDKMPLDKVDAFERAVVNAYRGWDRVKGVYAQTKDGTMKFIIAKK